MLEWYEAYADVTDAMARTESLVAAAAIAANGTTIVERDGVEVDLAPPWPRVPLARAIEERSGIDPLAVRDPEELRRLAVAAGAAAAANDDTWPQLVDRLLSHFVEPHVTTPVFLVDYPVELSPLARRREDDPSMVERFEAFVAGHGGRERLLGAERSRRPARPLRGAGPQSRGRRRRGAAARRRLRGGAPLRHAADGWRRARDRPARDAAARTAARSATSSCSRRCAPEPCSSASASRAGRSSCSPRTRRARWDTTEIGREHLLLGLLRVDDDLVALLGEPEDVRRRVVELVGLGEESAPGQLPFTPGAQGRDRASGGVPRWRTIGPLHSRSSCSRSPAHTAAIRALDTLGAEPSQARRADPRAARRGARPRRR